MDLVAPIFVLVQSGDGVYSAGRTYWASHGEEILDNYKRYGLATTVFINFVVPEAGRTIHRVKHHVFGQDSEHTQLFKISFTESFTMIGVAGAIIAQIAFTGLSLDKLNDTHWTAYAAFVVSLIAGCLAVYYSCTMQLLLSGLHGPREILEWLTAPKTSRVGWYDDLPNIYSPESVREWIDVHSTSGIFRALRRRQGMPPLEISSPKSILKWLRVVYGWPIHQAADVDDVPGNMQFNSHEWLANRNPSISAALLLVAPSQLLTPSLSAFLSGLGIYLGAIYGLHISDM